MANNKYATEAVYGHLAKLLYFHNKFLDVLLK